MTVMQDLQAKDGNSFAPFCCSMPLTRIRTSTLPDKVLPMVLQSEGVQAVLTKSRAFAGAGTLLDLLLHSL